MLSKIFARSYTSEDLEETQLFDYLTCLKLFRLFRLTRHAKCLELLIKIFYINLKDLLRLTILIIFGVFYFGLTQFILEQLFPENEIKNIGEALWHVNIPSNIFFPSSSTISLSGIYSYPHYRLFRHRRISISIVCIRHCWCLVWSNIYGDYSSQSQSIVSNLSQL